MNLLPSVCLQSVVSYGNCIDLTHILRTCKSFQKAVYTHLPRVTIFPLLIRMMDWTLLLYTRKLQSIHFTDLRDKYRTVTPEQWRHVDELVRITCNMNSETLQRIRFGSFIWQSLSCTSVEYNHILRYWPSFVSEQLVQCKQLNRVDIDVDQYDHTHHVTLSTTLHSTLPNLPRMFLRHGWNNDDTSHYSVRHLLKIVTPSITELVWQRPYDYMKSLLSIFRKYPILTGLKKFEIQDEIVPNCRKSLKPISTKCTQLTELTFKYNPVRKHGHADDDDDEQDLKLLLLSSPTLSCTRTINMNGLTSQSLTALRLIGYGMTMQDMCSVIKRNHRLVYIYSTYGFHMSDVHSTDADDDKSSSTTTTSYTTQHVRNIQFALVINENNNINRTVQLRFGIIYGYEEETFKNLLLAQLSNSSVTIKYCTNINNKIIDDK